MQKAWNIKDGLKVVEIRKNIFLFILDSEEEGRRILRGRPWSVQGHLLCLQERGQYEITDEIDFSCCPFWIQLHDVPLEAMSVENIRRFGSKFGRLLLMEDPEYNGLMLCSFLRFRALIEVDRALVPGFWIQRPNGKKAWVKVKYEKLPNFYFKCGCLVHESKSCNVERLRSEANASEPRYGSWLGVVQARSFEETVIVEDHEWFKSEGFSKNRKAWVENSSKPASEELEVTEVDLRREEKVGMGKVEAKGRVQNETECVLSVNEEVNKRLNKEDLYEEKQVERCNRWEESKGIKAKGKLPMRSRNIDRPKRILKVRRKFCEGEVSGVKVITENYLVDASDETEDYSKAIVPYVEQKAIKEVAEKLSNMLLKRNAEDDLEVEGVKRRKIDVQPEDNKENAISLFADHLKKERLKKKRNLRKSLKKGGSSVKKECSREVLKEIQGNVTHNNEEVTDFLVNARRLMEEGVGGWPITATKEP